MNNTRQYRHLVRLLQAGAALGEISTDLLMRVADQGYDLDAIFRRYEQ